MVGVRELGGVGVPRVQGEVGWDVVERVWKTAIRLYSNGSLGLSVLRAGL